MHVPVLTTTASLRLSPSLMFRSSARQVKFRPVRKLQPLTLPTWTVPGERRRRLAEQGKKGRHLSRMSVAMGGPEEHSIDSHTIEYQQRQQLEQKVGSDNIFSQGVEEEEALAAASDAENDEGRGAESQGSGRSEDNGSQYSLETPSSRFSDGSSRGFGHEAGAQGVKKLMSDSAVPLVSKMEMVWKDLEVPAQQRLEFMMKYVRPKPTAFSLMFVLCAIYITLFLCSSLSFSLRLSSYSLLSKCYKCAAP